MRLMTSIFNKSHPVVLWFPYCRFTRVLLINYLNLKEYMITSLNINKTNKKRRFNSLRASNR